MPGVIKYRAACDHCSTNKIKCTQERPSCTRCRSLGRDCNYSRSLRAGKPPRSNQALNRKVPNPPVLPRHDSVVDISRPAISPRAFQAVPNGGDYSRSRQETTWTTTAGSYPTPPAIAPNGNADISFYPELTGCGGLDSSGTSPMESNWFFDFDAGNDMLTDMKDSAFGSPPSSSSQQSTPSAENRCLRHTSLPMLDFNPARDDLLSSTASPLTATTSLPSAYEDQSDRCVRIATETLNSLYEMPSIQLAATSSKQASADQVLSSASKAVQICSNLISCPCPKDFHLPILIAVLASKILAWYQAVASIRDLHTKLPVDGVQQYTRELVGDGPLALGAYKIDSRVGWVLKNHIVLGQLQTLNEIVERYQERFCSFDDNKQVRAGEGAKLYDSMAGFLKARLQCTIQEIEGRLRTHGSGGEYGTG